jgi:hypothetical protein
MHALPLDAAADDGSCCWGLCPQHMQLCATHTRLQQHDQASSTSLLAAVFLQVGTEVRAAGFRARIVAK